MTNSVIERSKKILRRKDDIMAYLDIGEAMFDFFVEKGLPVAVINNKWFAHTDNLDEFFRRITRGQLGVQTEEKKKEHLHVE